MIITLPEARSAHPTDSGFYAGMILTKDVLIGRGADLTLGRLDSPPKE
jgi:hypothetical protein